MSRRLITHRVRCAHTGCVEAAHFEYGSAREREAHTKTLRERPWRCTRHTAPDEVLSDTNTERTVVLIATPGDGYSADKLFWREEGAERIGSGLTYGPGFKAYAGDFAPGTRIEITARVLPPTTPYPNPTSPHPIQTRGTMTTTPAALAFDDFDAFHEKWRTAMDAEGIPFDPTLIDEAIDLGERVLAEAEAPGQGPEYALISALAHIDTVNENRDEDSDDDEDLIDAADALDSEMASLVNG